MDESAGLEQAKLSRYLNSIYTKKDLIDILIDFWAYDMVPARPNVPDDIPATVLRGPGRPSITAQERMGTALRDALDRLYPAPFTLRQLAVDTGISAQTLSNMLHSSDMTQYMPRYLAAYMKQGRQRERTRVSPLWGAIFDLHFMHLHVCDGKKDLGVNHAVLWALNESFTERTPGRLNAIANQRATNMYTYLNPEGVISKQLGPELPRCREYCKVSDAFLHEYDDPKWHEVKNIRDLLVIDGVSTLEYKPIITHIVEGPFKFDIAKQIMGYE